MVCWNRHIDVPDEGEAFSLYTYKYFVYILRVRGRDRVDWIVTAQQRASGMGV